MAGEVSAQQIALAFLQGFWDSDVECAMSYCAPGATWQFARSLPYPRQCDVREALQAIVDDMFQSFDPEGFGIEIHHVISQDNQVMVEYSAHGATRDGHPYDNDYVMCITVSDGKVSSVRPHTDTLHLTQLLMAETAAEG